MKWQHHVFSVSFVYGFAAFISLMPHATYASPELLKDAKQELSPPTQPVEQSESRIATVKANLSDNQVPNDDFWSLQVSYSQFQVTGAKQLDYVKQSSFEDQGTPMNHWGVGLKLNHRLSDKYLMSKWLELQGGRTNATAQSQSGRPIRDIQIQTLSAALGTLIHRTVWNDISVGIGLLAGTLHISQVSSNASARFQENSWIISPLARLHLDLWKSISMGFEYRNMHFLTDPDVRVSDNQYFVQMELKL